MVQHSFRLIFIFIAAVIGFIFFNKYVLKDKPSFYPKFLVNFESRLFSKAENFNGLIGKVENFNRLSNENDRLKRELRTTVGLKARIEDLENENDFLRRAARIAQRFDQPVIYAGIFNLNLSPAGYNVLLNQGLGDGVAEGDVVVTAEGVLVGKVDKALPNFSRILFVADPEFNITAKVISSGTSGIARGALNEGMYLDFVIQGDEISAGDMLVSTGSDSFPPALVIGSVDEVDSNPTQMFKKVKIRPAVDGVELGRVLVIKVK